MIEIPSPCSSIEDREDAIFIKTFAEVKSIRALIHVTSIENLRGIVEQKAVLCRSILDKNGLKYKPFDKLRLDRKSNYVNTSLSYFNFLMYYDEIKKAKPIVQLVINPEFLWKSGTLYCQVNAAKDGGARIKKGYQGFISMFDEGIEDRSVPQTRIGKPSRIPTSIQAEVLIQKGILLSDVKYVGVRNDRIHDMVLETGWQGEVTVNPKIFKYRNEWIST